ncbi:S-adenosylmethionine-dependent methyltransferase [Aspergillus melleus]|uniref:S-adenosylmethionine-dependent methyltransferase n=1 Tax=Aspergillus melleus TaxID=138277 RepID=A0ACC3B7B8_9EURO|nr:S-adenosylmethionine-dependent methyltransferase [Aspergillus melleus]
MNPLQKGIHSYLTTHISQSVLSDHGISLETLLPTLPKRYTVYEPMLLLPVNALSTPPAWSALYQSLSDEDRTALYASIAKAFSALGVTHVAINAPIALTDVQGQENKMRSPVGLVPLYGNFGALPSGDDEMGQPGEEDLRRAFWVRTVQNHGIVQIWAPLYTMFSRGNITEKARILGHGGAFEGLDASSLRGDVIGDISVVDMYAGIGYFVFSYLKRGAKRVWGWEINGWSVEGLRRGCVENGWGCKVVRVREDGTLSEPIPELVENLRDSDKVVIFHGDNRFAADILMEIKELLSARQAWNSIRHVNLGLLPSSSAAWSSACKMIDSRTDGWVHVHENVDVQHIEEKSQEISKELGRLRAQVLGIPEVAVDCRHVEQVKTYAPGVMHCVFDMRLPSSEPNLQRSV